MTPYVPLVVECSCVACAEAGFVVDKCAILSLELSPPARVAGRSTTLVDDCGYADEILFFTVRKPKQ
jgi:hypothetical protein